jgi:hypothetical protein
MSSAIQSASSENVLRRKLNTTQHSNIIDDVVNRWESKTEEEKKMHLMEKIATMPQKIEEIDEERKAIVGHYSTRIQQTANHMHQAASSHSTNLEELVDLYNARMLERDIKFHEAVQKTKGQFQYEAEDLEQEHQQQMESLQAQIRAAGEKGADQEAADLKGQEKSLEEIHEQRQDKMLELKAHEESKIQSLEEQYDLSKDFVEQTLEQNNTEFKDLKGTYDELKGKFDYMRGKLQHLRIDLKHWNDKSDVDQQVFEEKLQYLAVEKQQMALKQQVMKEEIQKSSDEQRKHMCCLAKSAHQKRQELRYQIKHADKVLRQLMMVQGLEENTNCEYVSVFSRVLEGGDDGTALQLLKRRQLRVQADLVTLKREKKDHLENQRTIIVSALKNKGYCSISALI